MKYCLGLLIILVNSNLLAHNGKLAYVSATTPKTIDGDQDDWASENWIDLDAYFGEPISDIKDLKGAFKLAFNPDEKALYLLTKISDDYWSEGDRYEFYVNGIHDKRAGGVATFRFRSDTLSLIVHEIKKDPLHAFISEDQITYVISRSGNDWILEAKIILNEFIRPDRTIGIDHQIVDRDEDPAQTTYLNWGIGHSGFWKTYNSGQLGDAILMNDVIENAQVSGRVEWVGGNGNSQSFVDITNRIFPEIWTRIRLDSNNYFTTKLPKGKYYVSTSYGTTEPFDGHGYDNQKSVDPNFRYYFSIDGLDPIHVDSIAIAIIESPEYLYEEAGLLEKYEIKDNTAISSFIDVQMKYYNIPGASVAIIKNGEIVYDEIFGVKSALTKEPITKQTHFQAASVTKPVFAFIVNRLVDRGEFDLDKPLYEILPFKNYEDDERYKKITGRMVLNHQTGMLNWALGGPGGWDSDNTAELQFDPGTAYGYSGEAFEYLGRVIEKVTNKNLNDLLKEEVINALNIPELYFVGFDSLEMAQGHVQSNPTYWSGYASTPGVAHSMLTNAHNFIHFVLALINAEGLSAKQYHEMFERTVMAAGYPVSPDNNYWDLGLGLGFFVQSTVAGKGVMHGGSNGDFQCEFVFYPDRKDGFAIFTNSNTGHKLGQALGKYLFYGGVPKPNRQ